jgi:hypothetical protein
MRDFLDQNTIERRGTAISVEGLRRVYLRTHGPITPAAFRQGLIAAGCRITDVCGGGQLVLHRRRRDEPCQSASS